MPHLRFHYEVPVQQCHMKWWSRPYDRLILLHVPPIQPTELQLQQSGIPHSRHHCQPSLVAAAVSQL